MSSHSDPTNYMRHKSSPTGTYFSIPRLTQTLHQPLNLSPTCKLDFNKTSFTKNLFICDLLSLSHLVQLSFEGEVYHHRYYYYSSVPVLQNGAFFFSTDPQQQCMRTLSHSPQKLTRWWRRDDAEQEEEVGYLYRFIVFTVPGGGGAELRHRFLRWFG